MLRLTELDITEYFNLVNDDRNSLLYWFPKVEKLTKVPKTTWITVDFDVSWYVRLPRKIVEAAKEKADEIGYPLFARTDVNSGKHQWYDTCFVYSPHTLQRNLKNLVIDTIHKNLIFRAFCFRELLHLDSYFRAFSGRLPISTEVRVLFDNHKVNCWFFYWIKDAIRYPRSTKWEYYIEKMEKTAYNEQDIFINEAKKVAKEFDGFWSVDFARTENGEWYLIDMALGKVSWISPHKYEVDKHETIAPDC